MRGLIFASTVLMSAPAFLMTAPAFAQSEKTVEIDSRGQHVRALLLMPAGEPVGSVILMAGGNGRLDLGEDGRIWSLINNQLVYTRALYAKAGYVTLVPDLAPDLKIEKDNKADVVEGYRAGAPHAQDIGAMVEYLRKIKAPVVLAGTSLGSNSVLDGIVRLKGSQRPDAGVITSPALDRPGTKEMTVQKVAADPKRIDVPLLTLVNKKDVCPASNTLAVNGFKAWIERGGRDLDLVTLDGDAKVIGNPCDANSPHGFVGLDQKVVDTITRWIKDKNLAAH
jgi:dienelactone hydrolase